MLVILTVFSHSASTKGKKGEVIFKPDDLVMWVFSDIQPRREKEREYFETAADDVSGMKNIDMAICAGDISQNANKKEVAGEFEWFYETFRKTGINEIYEICGNHDARNIDYYLRMTGKPLHYSLEYGNLIIILLSDEEDSSGSDISDEAFRWWKSIVENNRDKIIITVTHSHVEGTGFCYNIPPYRNVRESGRFTEVLKKERVELWLFGHTHIPSCLGQSKRRIYSLNGTVFINVASIREDYVFSDAESRIIVLENGSDEMTVKFRNHRSREFNSFREEKIRMKTKFRYNGEKPVMNVFRLPILSD